MSHDVSTPPAEEDSERGTERAPYPRSITPDTRVKIPIQQLLGVILFVATGVFCVGGIYYALEAHASDKVRHLDPDKVAERGGPVLKEDLRDAQRALYQRISESEERILTAVKAQASTAVNLRGCRPGPGGSMTCRLEAGN